ncbi:streptomycin resistance protein, partial [Escherichia coli]
MLNVSFRSTERQTPTPAIVKGLKPIEDIADELRGADYLVWRNGRGAVRLL